MNDLIDREQALKAVSFDSEAYFAINNLPSAEKTEVQHGRWKEVEDRTGRSKNFFCSECGYGFFVDTCMFIPMWNFCPNCGTDMREME